MDRNKMMNLIGTGLLTGVLVISGLFFITGGLPMGLGGEGESSAFGLFGESEDEGGLFGFGESEDEGEDAVRTVMLRYLICKKGSLINEIACW